MFRSFAAALSNFLNSDLADRVVVLNYGAKIADGPRTRLPRNRRY